MSSPAEARQARSPVDRILDALTRLSNSKHLIALRDGIISAVPIILVGSTFLLIGSQAEVLDKEILPHFPAMREWGPVQWYLTNYAVILIPFRLTMGILSLYVAFTVAASLARQYNLPPLPQGLGAVATFLMACMPQVVVLGQNPDGKDLKAFVLQIRSIPEIHTPLSPDGLFLAIFCALGAVELARLIIRPQADAPKDEGTVDEMGVPRAVGDAFRSFLPMLLAVTSVWFVRHVLGFDVLQGLIHALTPLEALGDSLLAVIIVNVALHVLQFAGIHGVSVINAVFLTFWQMWVIQNGEAHLAGQPLPHVTAYPFYQWFIWIGGAGATLPLAFLALFSKHPHMRHIGRISVVPSLFNVNEPLIFGLPVVLNPALGIPFVAAPVCCGIVAYLSMSWGWVGRPWAEVPWVLPCFRGAPLSTGSGSALALLLVNLCISAAIWFPFLKAYERALVAKPLPEPTETV